MKKHLFLTSLVALVATAGMANAGVETTFSQVKSNLETEFKQAPDAADYQVPAPNGDETDVSGVSASDYDDFIALTSADGDNVKINDTVSLNIAQGTVDVTDYQYKSFDAEGNDSYVSGDTVVTDLNKDYTLADGVTVVNVSTSTSEAPAVSLKTASDEPVYKNADGTFYLAKDAEGNIQLNGDANTTVDNKASFDALMAIYNEDVENVSGLYTELTGYKQNNQDNFDAVITAKNTDNEAIQSIVDNKAAYTTKNNQYLADKSANTSYDGSVAQAIDKSIASAQTATLTSAKDYADSLADNYDAAGSADAEKTRAQGEEAAIRSEFAAADTTLQGNIDAEATARQTADATLQGNIDAEATARQTADATLQGNIDAEATARQTADTTLQGKIDNEVARAMAQEAAIRGDFAAADAQMLANANAYTDSKVDSLEKNVSGGVAAATALSAVEVSNVKKGEMSVGGGYGYYNSQSAMALGAALGLSDNWSVNAGAGIASGDKTQVSFRAGTNYKFKLF